jgi:hypothetical protein
MDSKVLEPLNQLLNVKKSSFEVDMRDFDEKEHNVLDRHVKLAKGLEQKVDESLKEAEKAMKGELIEEESQPSQL